MTDKRNEMYFSQAALAAYQTCPLKFRYRYLDELHWLYTTQHNTHQEERRLGDHFHLLAQRYFQKVALDQLFTIASPGPLGNWLDNLRRRFPVEEGLAYYPEQELRVEIEGVRLTAKYDLLSVSEGRVFIYDWKTRTKPWGRRVRSLQTQVYSLVLCAAAPFGTLRPDDITMVFWNPRFPSDEQVWPYSDMLYHQDRAELTGLIARITATPYQGFPAVGGAEGDPACKECRQCEYAAVCYSARHAGGSGEYMFEQSFSWDAIEEISYEEA